jgi:hypothetical protein
MRESHVLCFQRGVALENIVKEAATYRRVEDE